MTPKISLAQMIEEVDYELRMRRGYTSRRVSAGKMKRSESAYRIERMEAVLAWLKIFQRFEQPLRSLIGNMIAKEKADAPPPS